MPRSREEPRHDTSTLSFASRHWELGATAASLPTPAPAGSARRRVPRESRVWSAFPFQARRNSSRRAPRGIACSSSVAWHRASLLIAAADRTGRSGRPTETRGWMALPRPLRFALHFFLFIIILLIPRLFIHISLLPFLSFFSLFSSNISSSHSNSFS